MTTQGPLTDEELADLERVVSHQALTSISPLWLTTLPRLLSEVRALRAEKAERSQPITEHPDTIAGIAAGRCPRCLEWPGKHSEEQKAVCVRKLATRGKVFPA